MNNEAPKKRTLGLNTVRALLDEAAKIDRDNATVKEPDYKAAQDHALRQKLPADPGGCYKLRVYPHPVTGEIIRGYNKQTHTLIYVNKVGDLITYAPGDLSFPERARLAGGLSLLTRPERRKRWKEEKKRYKRIVAKRKAAEHETA